VDAGNTRKKVEAWAQTPQAVDSQALIQIVAARHSKKSNTSNQALESNDLLEFKSNLFDSFLEKTHFININFTSLLNSLIVLNGTLNGIEYTVHEIRSVPM